MKYIKIKLYTLVTYKAGQHFELRIVGSDVSRKYSTISPSGQSDILEFGIQIKIGGIVSPLLWDLSIGDNLDIVGPFGESFILTEPVKRPILLIGAGSGVTPLISMYRTIQLYDNLDLVRFIVSVKSEEYLFSFDIEKQNIICRFSQKDGRINKEFLQEFINTEMVQQNPLCYICGPDSFIESMVDYLLDMGTDEEDIKSERFI
jgi:ferredoxin-NADP reductase